MTDKKTKASTEACAVAFAACQALSENSILEDDDGQVRCNVCMANIGEPSDLIADEIMANAEHDEWCPVPMAFKALEARKAASDESH